jgi:hypothetical protein
MCVANRVPDALHKTNLLTSGAIVTMLACLDPLDLAIRDMLSDWPPISPQVPNLKYICHLPS